jgi:hypothetical protein
VSPVSVMRCNTFYRFSYVCALSFRLSGWVICTTRYVSVTFSILYVESRLRLYDWGFYVCPWGISLLCV